LDRLRSAGPLDGLLLALHGAMVSEDYASADSETLRRVRESITPNTPLILSLDMHANIAPPMVALPSATIAYRTYPHVDQRERGIECARLLARTLRGEVRPVQAHCKLPLLIHIVQQYTGAGPMAEILREVERVAAMPGILSASVAPGYIYADVPDMGVSVIVVADGDRTRAETEAKGLAQFIFAKRHDLNAALPDVPAAVRRAAGIEGTVCILDSGDNIGAGSPGDSTIIFQEILRQGVPKACVVLCDPDSAIACAERGVGSAVSLEVGAKTDDKHGKPVAITGRVAHISDGVFAEPEPRHGGMRTYDQGLTAVLETSDGHTVVLNSLRVMPTSLQQLLSLGIVPQQLKVIVVKGVTAPRAAYDPIAAEVIVADSPGVSQAGPESFTYHNRPRSLFPLDEVSDWTPVCT
jgi:microcystin degradation protein MlrC